MLSLHTLRILQISKEQLALIVIPTLALCFVAAQIATAAPLKLAPKHRLSPVTAESRKPNATLLKMLNSGKLSVVDLSHELNAKTPHWPGKDNKDFRYEYFTSLAKDGSLEGRFAMDEHTGTHIDAQHTETIEHPEPADHAES